MCDPVTALAIGSAVVGAVGVGNSVIQGNQANNAAKDAASKAEANAKVQAQQADEAMNAANKKQPSVDGITAAMQQAAKGGSGSTMLTGPMGVDPGSLSLSKSTLLGA